MNEKIIKRAIFDCIQHSRKKIKNWGGSYDCGWNQLLIYSTAQWFLFFYSLLLACRFTRWILRVKFLFCWKRFCGVFLFTRCVHHVFIAMSKDYIVNFSLCLSALVVMINMSNIFLTHALSIMPHFTHS